MAEAALTLGVFGVFAFCLWLVTYKRMVALERRVGVLEGHTSVPREAR
jgi:hypothetical protein